MSLSGSRVGYKHRCTIQRNSGTGVDTWGDAASPSWGTHLSDVKCRAWTNVAREPVDDETTVAFEDRRLSVSIGTDVNETDRILSVTDAAGNEIFEGPMGIEGVVRHTDHLELALERIR